MSQGILFKPTPPPPPTTPAAAPTMLPSELLASANPNAKRVAAKGTTSPPPAASSNDGGRDGNTTATRPPSRQEREAPQQSLRQFDDALHRSKMDALRQQVDRYDARPLLAVKTLGKMLEEQLDYMASQQRSEGGVCARHRGGEGGGGESEAGESPFSEDAQNVRNVSNKNQNTSGSSPAACWVGQSGASTCAGCYAEGELKSNGKGSSAATTSSKSRQKQWYAPLTPSQHRSQLRAIAKAGGVARQSIAAEQLASIAEEIVLRYNNAAMAALSAQPSSPSASAAASDTIDGRREDAKNESASPEAAVSTALDLIHRALEFLKPYTLKLYEEVKEEDRKDDDGQRETVGGGSSASSSPSTSSYFTVARMLLAQEKTMGDFPHLVSMLGCPPSIAAAALNISSSSSSPSSPHDSPKLRAKSVVVMTSGGTASATTTSDPSVFVAAASSSPSPLPALSSSAADIDRRLEAIGAAQFAMPLWEVLAEGYGVGRNTANNSNNGTGDGQRGAQSGSPHRNSIAKGGADSASYNAAAATPSLKNGRVGSAGQRRANLASAVNQPSSSSSPAAVSASQSSNLSIPLPLHQHPHFDIFNKTFRQGHGMLFNAYFYPPTPLRQGSDGDAAANNDGPVDVSSSSPNSQAVPTLSLSSPSAHHSSPLSSDDLFTNAPDLPTLLGLVAMVRLARLRAVTLNNLGCILRRKGDIIIGDISSSGTGGGNDGLNGNGNGSSNSIPRHGYHLKEAMLCMKASAAIEGQVAACVGAIVRHVYGARLGGGGMGIGSDTSSSSSSFASQVRAHVGIAASVGLSTVYTPPMAQLVAADCLRRGAMQKAVDTMLMAAAAAAEQDSAADGSGGEARGGGVGTDGGAASFSISRKGGAANRATNNKANESQQQQQLSPTNTTNANAFALRRFFTKTTTAVASSSAAAINVSQITHFTSAAAASGLLSDHHRSAAHGINLLYYAALRQLQTISEGAAGGSGGNGGAGMGMGMGMGGGGGGGGLLAMCTPLSNLSALFLQGLGRYAEAVGFALEAVATFLTWAKAQQLKHITKAQYQSMRSSGNTNKSSSPTTASASPAAQQQHQEKKGASAATATAPTPSSTASSPELKATSASLSAADEEDSSGLLLTRVPSDLQLVASAAALSSSSFPPLLNANSMMANNSQSATTTAMELLMQTAARLSAAGIVPPSSLPFGSTAPLPSTTGVGASGVVSPTRPFVTVNPASGSSSPLLLTTANHTSMNNGSPTLNNGGGRVSFAADAAHYSMNTPPALASAPPVGTAAAVNPIAVAIAAPVTPSSVLWPDTILNRDNVLADIKKKGKQSPSPAIVAAVCGLAPVLFMNLAMALEPSDPKGALEAYATALLWADGGSDENNKENGEREGVSPARAITNGNNKQSGGAIIKQTILTNRDRYYQWLRERKELLVTLPNAERAAAMAAATPSLSISLQPTFSAFAAAAATSSPTVSNSATAASPSFVVSPPQQQHKASLSANPLERTMSPHRPSSASSAASVRNTNNRRRNSQHPNNNSNNVNDDSSSRSQQQQHVELLAMAENAVIEANSSSVLTSGLAAAGTVHIGGGISMGSLGALIAGGGGRGGPSSPSPPSVSHSQPSTVGLTAQQRYAKNATVMGYRSPTRSGGGGGRGSAATHHHQTHHQSSPSRRSSSSQANANNAATSEAILKAQIIRRALAVVGLPFPPPPPPASPNSRQNNSNSTAAANDPLMTLVPPADLSAVSKMHRLSVFKEQHGYTPLSDALQTAAGATSAATTTTTTAEPRPWSTSRAQRIAERTPIAPSPIVVTPASVGGKGRGGMIHKTEEEKQREAEAASIDQLAVGDSNIKSGGYTFLDPSFAALIVEAQTPLQRVGAAINAADGREAAMRATAAVASGSGGGIGRSRRASSITGGKGGGGGALLSNFNSVSTPSFANNLNTNGGGGGGGLSPFPSSSSPTNAPNNNNNSGRPTAPAPPKELRPLAALSAAAIIAEEAKKGDALLSMIVSRLNVLLRHEDAFHYKYVRARRIQCMWRCFVARREAQHRRFIKQLKAERLAKTRDRAARVITRFFRGIVDGKKAAEAAQRERARISAAIFKASQTLQKYARRWIAIREVGRVRERHLRRTRNIITAQKIVRVRKARRVLASLRLERDEKEQAAIRREKTFAAATKIQAMMRRHWVQIAQLAALGQHKKALALDGQKYREWAATTIQRHVRGFLLRISPLGTRVRQCVQVARNKFRTAQRRNAQMRIAALWRGYWIRSGNAQTRQRAIAHPIPMLLLRAGTLESEEKKTNKRITATTSIRNSGAMDVKAVEFGSDVDLKADAAAARSLVAVKANTAGEATIFPVGTSFFSNYRLIGDRAAMDGRRRRGSYLLERDVSRAAGVGGDIQFSSVAATAVGKGEGIKKGSAPSIRETYPPPLLSAASSLKKTDADFILEDALSGRVGGLPIDTEFTRTRVPIPYRFEAPQTSPAPSSTSPPRHPSSFAVENRKTAPSPPVSCEVDLSQVREVARQAVAQHAEHERHYAAGKVQGQIRMHLARRQVAEEGRKRLDAPDRASRL